MFVRLHFSLASMMKSQTKKKTRTQRVYKLLKNKSINKKQLIIDEEQERVGHHILIELVQQVVCSDHKALPGFVEFSPYQV